MVIKIIQTNLLSHLNLEKFSFDKDGEHGELILEALCASEIKLVSFNLAYNKVWWTRQECLQLLPVFLRQQERLEELDLSKGYFTSDE